MAAPTFRAAGAISSGTGARTPGAPTGLAADDVELLLVETANEAVTLSTTAGFAELTNDGGQGTAGSTDATRMTVFWRRWDGVAGNPTVADAGNHVICIRLAFIGCITTGDPWDVFGSNQQTSATTSGSVSGVTTTVDETCIVSVCAQDLPDSNNTSQFSGWTNANLVSITESSDNSRNSGNGGAIGSSHGELASAGATGATTFTAATSSLKSNVMVALMPPQLNQTVSVDPAELVAHAPDVVTATTVSRTVDTAVMVAAAPSVATLRSVTSIVGAAVMIAFAPDVVVATGAVTRIVEPAPMVAFAPTVTASAAGDAATGTAIARIRDRKALRSRVRPPHPAMSGADADLEWQTFWQMAMGVYPISDPGATDGHVLRDFSGRGNDLEVFNNFGITDIGIGSFGVGQHLDNAGGNAAEINELALFSDYVESGQTFTLVWVAKIHDVSSAANLLLFEEGTTSAVSIGFTSAGLPHFSKNNAADLGEWDFTASSAISDGDEVVIVGVFNGSDAQIWLNGRLVASQAETVTDDGPYDSLEINSSPSSGADADTTTFAVYALKGFIPTLPQRLYEDPFGPLRRRSAIYVPISLGAATGDQTVTVDVAPMVATAPAVATATGAVTRTVDTAVAVLSAPEVNTAAAVTRIVGPAVGIYHAPNVQAVASVTVAVDVASVVQFAPDVVTATGAVTRVVGVAELVAHAPAVIASSGANVVVVDVAAAVINAPAVATATGVVTRTVGVAPMVVRAPSAQVSQAVTFATSIETEHLAAQTIVVDVAAMVAHAPAVVASTGQTRTVDTATMAAVAPAVQTQTGAVTRAVDTAVVAMVAPAVVVAAAVTRTVDVAVAILAAPSVVAVAAKSVTVDVASMVAVAPAVVAATGAVVRAVGVAVMVPHAPAVTATSSVAQTRTVDVAVQVMTAPAIANVTATVALVPPLTVECDSTVTSVTCDVTITSVTCDSTVTSVALWES